MVNKDDCWLYAGISGRSGHGQIYEGMVNGKIVKQQAHRVVYENMVGEIPDGLELDHLCETPPCINPAHMEPVPHRINTLRHYRNRTHCKHGHEFTPENTYIRRQSSNMSKSNPTGEYRVCRRCHYGK